MTKVYSKLTFLKMQAMQPYTSPQLPTHQITGVLKCDAEQHEPHPRKFSEMQMLGPHPRPSRWFLCSSLRTTAILYFTSMLFSLGWFFLHHHAHHCLYLACAAHTEIQLKNHHHFRLEAFLDTHPMLLEYHHHGTYHPVITTVYCPSTNY